MFSHYYSKQSPFSNDYFKGTEGTYEMLLAGLNGFALPDVIAAVFAVVSTDGFI